MANAVKIPNGLLLDFTPVDGGLSDKFLAYDTNGNVVKYSSIDATRISNTGTLSEATSSVLTISATGSLLTNATIQVKQAGTSQSGYLSSTDWNTFNGKQNSTLASGNILIGNASNVATAQSLSGAIALTNAGITSINSNYITNSMINSTASIAMSKLAALSSSLMVSTDGSGFLTTVPGLTVTKAGYLVNISSDVQAQLNSKLSATVTSAATGDLMYYNGSDWVNFPRGTNGQILTSTSGSIAWGTAAANGLPTGGTANQFLTKIDGTNYNAQWHSLIAADITDVSATASQINVLATGFYDATSSIQNQLNNKLSRSLATNNFWIGDGSGVPVATTDLPAGTTIGTTVIYHVGGSAVALADGGTGTSLSAPGADRLWGWDNTDASIKFITIGSGLTYTHSTHTLSASGGISGLTTGRIPYAASSTTLADDAAMTFTSPYITLAANSRTLDIGKYQNQGYNILGTKTGTGGAYTKLIIQSAAGISGDANGDEVVINGGAGYGPSNGNGGNLTLNGGAGGGSGNPGIIVLGSITKFGSTNTTGAGSAALGSNCPAVTATAPYTWIKIQTSDGSTGYIPVWK